jgi:carbonic anhydrase
MMNIGSEGNYLADRIMSLTPTSVGGAKTEGAPLNARQFLPADLNYFMYSGSLTTPACTEGVRWFVLKTPVTVSSFAVQLSKDIIRVLPGYDGFEINNRPIVPTHGRPVLTNR